MLSMAWIFLWPLPKQGQKIVGLSNKLDKEI